MAGMQKDYLPGVRCNWMGSFGLKVGYVPGCLICCGRQKYCLNRLCLKLNFAYEAENDLADHDSESATTQRRNQALTFGPKTWAKGPNRHVGNLNEARRPSGFVEFFTGCPIWLVPALRGGWEQGDGKGAVNLMPGMGNQSANLYSSLSHPLYNTFFLTVMAGLVAGVIFMLLVAWWPKGNRNPKWSAWSGWGNARLNVPGSVASFLRISFGIIWTFDGMFQLRPDLPGGFVSQVAQPSLQGAPSIIQDVINPLLNLWNTHPIKADVLSGWLQLLIGIALIFLNSGRALQLILWMSVLWSTTIFVFGNGFGIFYHGASFVSGAPAAILIYGFVSLYLLGLAHDASWTKHPKTLSVSVAAFLIIGGVLQALPAEGYWGNSLATMFSGMASANQPGIFSAVIRWAADLAKSEPILTNAIFVLLIFTSAISLIVTKRRWAVWFAIAVAALGWWLGQDFGIFSSTATDFNSGLPLILVLSAILRQHRTEDLAHSSAPAQSATPYHTPLTAASLVVACVVGTVVSALIFSISIFGVDSAAMATVDSAGYVYLSPTTAPGFTLMNFDHRVISLSSIEGSPILLTFLDPSCPYQCQIMTKEMIGALKQLGKLASRVKLVAIDVNPSTNAASDIASVVRRYGINNYKNWYFLTGSKSQLRKVWKGYNIDVIQTKNGAVRYSQLFYFIDNLGVEQGLLRNTATASYAGSYSTLIADNLRSLL